MDKLGSSAPLSCHEEDAQVPTVCLIGATGTGKSATGNTLFKCSTNALFKVSGDPNSTTVESVAKTLLWRDDVSKGYLRCVDTPGLSDTKGRDSDHNLDIVALLRDEVRYVNVFLLLLNAEEPRMREDLQDMLKNFRDSFGQEFISNLMVCFTHWAYDRRSRKKREKHESTEHHKRSWINEQLRAVLGHDFDCPCVFLDNTLNISDRDELEDMYESELDDVLEEFERQLDEVHQCALQFEPFCCSSVKATESRKDILRKTVNNLLHMSQHFSHTELGRRLILAEQDVIKKGWLTWKRKQIWGVLRRQHLRFFSDKSCSEPDGPQHVDLTGCICTDRRSAFGRGWYFTIYRPLQEAEASTYCSHEFRVESEMERQRWILLIAEATQISESCYRIEKFYNTLMDAQNEIEYVGAINTIREKTLVIPVEWVQQCSERDAPQIKVADPPTLRQAEKDLVRDEVLVEGCLFKKPQLDDLAIAIAHIIAENTSEHMKDDKTEAKATMLARDAILSCSRTSGGGDMYSAVRLLFGTDPYAGKGHTLVNLVVVAKESEPVKVRVFHETSRSVNSCDGTWGIAGDQSAEGLSIERVLKMDLEWMRQLKVDAVSMDMWVDDKEMKCCMRCGAQFNMLVRRHHCRACGALICHCCSKQQLQTTDSCNSLTSTRLSSSGDSVMAGDIAAGLPMLITETKKARVCFLCYQKAVVADLNKRKEVGAGTCGRSDDEESIPSASSVVGSFAEDGDQFEANTEIVHVTFEPGEIGMFQEDGKVISVDKGKQAERLGVQAGWRLIALGDQRCCRFEDKAFVDAQNGNAPFQVAFVKANKMRSSTIMSTMTLEEFLAPVVEKRRDEYPSINSDEAAHISATAGLPAVSVEMGSRYKVCSDNPQTEDAVLFTLECRYVKVVRWSGLADSGRIFISIIE